MISIIAAVAKNRAIGYQNKLIYWLPNDLKRFKQLTTGHTIIMGSNTFRSLPKGALPNRRNVVLSRSSKDFPGCDVYTSLDKALKSCQPDEDVYIIGGASIYNQMIPYVDKVLLTKVNEDGGAEVFFHNLDEDPNFECTEIGEPLIDNGHEIRFTTYVNKNKKSI